MLQSPPSVCGLSNDVKVLSSLSYYLPNISGLTIYVERLARELVARGHEVTVLTSHFRPDLPREEVLDGVRVVRVPVAFRPGKGVVMPTFAWDAWRLAGWADVVHISLPQLEGSTLALAARLQSRKVVTTLMCELTLPAGRLNRAAEKVVAASHWLTGLLSHAIVTHTQDYAEYTWLMRRFPHKSLTIYPPIVVPPPDPTFAAHLAQQHGLNHHRVVGFAARLAEEKGAQYLLEAIPRVAEEFPDVRFAFTGEYQEVIGEREYERLRPLIERHQERVRLLGVLPFDQMSSFYTLCDVLALPSANSTEAFGMVQVEAMLNGVPVVATDLPGVREAVRVTQMGEVVPARDSASLAEALIRVLRDRPRYVRPRGEVAAIFDLKATVDFYERLLSS